MDQRWAGCRASAGQIDGCEKGHIHTAVSAASGSVGDFPPLTVSAAKLCDAFVPVLCIDIDQYGPALLMVVI